MYYNRTISKEFASLLEGNGCLRWLFDFVKSREDLDFLIGKNSNNEWISIYRGLSQVLRISNSRSEEIIKLDAAKAYKELTNNFYGLKSVSEEFKPELVNLLSGINEDPKFERYYNNKKEGFYQNILSRKFGICGSEIDDFVIIDKEAVIGYANIAERDEIYGKIRQEYKQLQETISDKDPNRYGKDLNKKPIGNELDFLALDKEGNILLIEYKHGTNTSGIYLSPLQIGMYYEIFTRFSKKDLETAVFDMLEQKQKIGLINPNWKKPGSIKNIIPVLIISNHNNKSSAKDKFEEILNICKEKKGDEFLSKILKYNYTIEENLTTW